MFGKDESLGERLEDKYNELKELIGDEENHSAPDPTVGSDSFGEMIDDVPPELEEEVQETDSDPYSDRVI